MSDAAVCAGAEEVLERYAATVFAAAYAMVKNKGRGGHRSGGVHQLCKGKTCV